MPKRVKFNHQKFIDNYQAKNECGIYIYTIRRLAKRFKINTTSVNNYRKRFGLKRHLK